MDEAESAALRAFLAKYQRRFSSRLATTELRRAANRRELVIDTQLAQALAGLELIVVTEAVADRAGALGPVQLRTLDAVHLASAEAVVDEIDAFVTYDERQGEAAVVLGLVVATPRIEAREDSVS